MRAVQLGFRLHQKWDEGAEAEFRRNEEEVYQPLFALMERNLQKHPGFHFSLMISGSWIELAEKYAPTLIERLKKIIANDGVELVAEPYYHSLAAFYDEKELTEQVKIYTEKVRDLFKVERRIVAMPELIYNDKIAKWAEDDGFAGMLAGDASRILDWRSANHVYEAADCQYLRVLFQNAKLVKMVEQADSEILTEKLDAETNERKQVISAVKFRKLLDLEFLRGSLVNLYFDAEVIRQQRKRGVIGFVDEFIATWLEDENNKFVNAAEACVVETPTMEISVKETASCRGDMRRLHDETLPVLVSTIEAQLPWWLSGCSQKQMGEMVYSLRRAVVASEDEKIMTKYRWLTQLDYQLTADVARLEEMRGRIQELQTEIDEVKKQQAVEISRAYTKKRDRGDIDARRGMKTAEQDDDTSVKVNFGKRRAGTDSRSVHAQDNDGAVVVRRVVSRPAAESMRRITVMENDHAIGVAEALQDAEEAEVVQPKVKKVAKSKGGRVRRVIKKLVIE